MSRNHVERDIGKLLKEIEFEIGQIQKVAGDIEQLLKDTKRSFCKIQENMNKHKRVRNLWLGQLRGKSGSLVFQNVASTPNLLFPLTETQRTLIRNIVAQSKRIQTLQAQLGFVIADIISEVKGFGRLEMRFWRPGMRLLEIDKAKFLEALSLASIQIRTIQEEIQEVRDNLTRNIIELDKSL